MAIFADVTNDAIMLDFHQNSRASQNITNNLTTFFMLSRFSNKFFTKREEVLPNKPLIKSFTHFYYDATRPTYSEPRQ